MRNTLIIGGICIVAIVIGAWLYFANTSTTVEAPTTTTPSAVPDQGKAVSFKVLDQGDNAKDMTVRKNYAIYNLADLTAFWMKAHSTDGKPVPIVDFTKDYVIAVFAGTEQTGGYSISVAQITDSDTTRSISINLAEPDDSCTVIEEQTSPYEFVVVPQSDAQTLTHTDIVAKKPCL